MNEGISVITCSVHPALCAQMLQSVEETIGTLWEKIVFDNRGKNWGLCKVYNACAREAQYPYLCFLHEDVLFFDSGWGKTITEFMAGEPRCGVVGFNGSTAALKNYAGWWSSPELTRRCNYMDPVARESKADVYCAGDFGLHYINPRHERFSQVLTIDGVFLMVSAKVWETYPFDESVSGFHGYDADFTFRVSLARRNYVYLGNAIAHLSSGLHDAAFCRAMRDFQKKWRNTLPRRVGPSRASRLSRFMGETSLALSFFEESRKAGLSAGSCAKHALDINGAAFISVLIFWAFACLIRAMYRRIFPGSLRERIWQARQSARLAREERQEAA